MSISSVLAVPLIPLASWIIHGQLGSRGRSRLHGVSAFSMIHFMSYARGLLIVVYCSLSDHMLFYAIVITPGSAQSAWEMKSIKASWELFSCQVPWNASRFKLCCTGAINLVQSEVSVCGYETHEEMQVVYFMALQCRKNTHSVVQSSIF